MMCVQMQIEEQSVLVGTVCSDLPVQKCYFTVRDIANLDYFGNMQK